jgi:alpha-L-arabinofuranosidase
MNKRIIPFIREGTGDMMIVILSFTLDVDLKKAIRKLVEAVTLWVRTTDEGWACWKQSKEDLNIGDLSLYYDEFQTWVRAQAELNKESSFIKLTDFEILYTLSSEDKVSYDLHLFHKESDNG